MGVVREVLTRLTAEGLVESEPQYGFRVVPCPTLTSSTSPTPAPPSRSWYSGRPSNTAAWPGNQTSSAHTTGSNAPHRWPPAAIAALAAHIQATTNVLLDQADARLDDTATA
jgi:hypothetical protein